MAKDMQQQQSALSQRTNDTSLDVDLPGLEADRVIQASDEDMDAMAAVADDEDNEDNEDDIDLSDEGDVPPELREEDIGLGHIAGIDEAEVGRELNVSGDEDNDEDDRGNPTGATQPGSP